MARVARAIFSGHPYHVAQRGNGRAQTFFGDAHHALYRDLLGEYCAVAGVVIWSRVLMPNHVHLILVPADRTGCGERYRRSIGAMRAISTPD
ncbi:MAG: transposase [Pseudomonadota bacterium]|jgi:putative transposase